MQQIGKKSLHIGKVRGGEKCVTGLLLNNMTEAAIEKGLCRRYCIMSSWHLPSWHRGHRSTLGAQQWASGWRLLPERSEKKIGKSDRFTVSCGCSLPCQRWEEVREWSSFMGGTVDKRVKGRTQGAPSSTQKKERDSQLMTSSEKEELR